jgi:hypothetical protein
MSTTPELDAKQASDESSASKESALREDVGATSAEYESRQEYLQGMRLRLTTAACVMTIFFSTGRNEKLICQ